MPTIRRVLSAPETRVIHGLVRHSGHSVEEVAALFDLPIDLVELVVSFMDEETAAPDA